MNDTMNERVFERKTNTNQRLIANLSYLMLSYIIHINVIDRNGLIRCFTFIPSSELYIFFLRSSSNRDDNNPSINAMVGM